MITQRFIRTLTIGLMLAVIPTAGCTEKEPVKTAETPTPLAKDLPPVPPAPDVEAAAPPADWTEIKDLAYDQRGPFLEGAARLETRVDDQIAALTAKRAVMEQNAVATADWDFAMKEMANARSYLRGMVEEQVKATAENWRQQRDKVGHAWSRTQNAYTKVETSTTQ